METVADQHSLTSPGDDAGSPGVPDAVRPPPRHRRFPLLDGMRAIAVLGVVLVHVSGTTGVGSSVLSRYLYHLNLGVTVFFLISGFLLYRPFIAHRVGGAAAPRTNDYFRRRALRIIPAYWLVVTVVTLAPGGIGLGGTELAGQYGLLHTLPFDAVNECSRLIFGCGLSQTWSLAVEASFYLALPLYVLAANRLAQGRPPARWVPVELGALALLAVASIVIQFVIFGLDLTSFIQGTLIGHMYWFGLGMGLAVISVGLDATTRRPAPIEWIGRRPALVWLGAFGAYTALVFYLPANAFFSGTHVQVVAHLGFGLVALLLMLPAVFGDGYGGVPRRVLANPAMAWLGLISYGIFLWHWPVLLESIKYVDGSPSFFPLLALVLAASILLASASYYLLERPALKLKYRRPPAGDRASTTTLPRP